MAANDSLRMFRVAIRMNVLLMWSMGLPKTFLRTLFSFSGYTHSHIAPFEFLVVKTIDGFVGLVGIGHLDESESTTSAGFTIGDDFCGSYFAIRTKQGTQVTFLDMKAQIGNIQIHKIALVINKSDKRTTAVE